MSTISSKVTTGVTFGSGYTSPLTIASTGSVTDTGADAVFASASYANPTIVSDGSISGGGGNLAVAYGLGFAGIDLKDGGTISNGSAVSTASIVGGSGAHGGYSSRFAGGYGGAGISLSGGGSIGNAGTIIGGEGGGGGFNPNSVFPTGYGGAYGGAGITLSGGGSVSNSGLIVGGQGGAGFPALYAGPGGYGAAGIKLSGGGNITNSGTIIGGQGGVSSGDLDAAPGSGGVAISLSSGGSIGNSGSIIGGQGGVGTNYTSRLTFTLHGAIGISLSGGGIISNGSAAGSGALIEGWVGLQASGGAGVTLTNFGTISGSSGTAAQLSASSLLVAEGGSKLIGKAVGGGGTLDLAGDAGTGTFSSIGSQYTGFAHIAVLAGANWTLTGTNTLGSGVTLNDAGQLTITTAQTVTGATIQLSGSLTDTAGITMSSGALIGTGTVVAGSIAGPGIVDASGGTLDLTGSIQNSATGLEIANGNNTLELDGQVSGGATISFGGTAGVLELTDFTGQTLTGFSGAVAGMQVGTSIATATTGIDLRDVTVADVTAASLFNNFIIVNEGSKIVADIQVATTTPAGTYVDWIPDSATGTEIFFSNVPCFCRGTLIRTLDGEVAIEELAIGDRVITLSGEAKPIKWIGHRAYEGRFIAGKREALPIRVAAGAVADGVPARDLWVSPTHSLYIDGVLAPAEYLLNGATIAQAESVERVEYFHIELDAHDVIFADGAPAETYLDCDNRGIFQNAGEFVRLYPGDDQSGGRFFAVRLEEGEPLLAAIRSRLERRAGLPDEESGMDHLPNPTLNGAVIGMLGEGGSLPDGWHIYSAADLGYGIVGSGQEDGIDYVDIRIFGTPIATTHTNQISFAGSGDLPAAIGDRWAVGADIRLCAGSLDNVQAIEIGLNLNDTARQYSSWLRATACTPLDGAIAGRRLLRSDTIADRNAAYLQPFLQIATTAGDAIDLTLRISRLRAALLGQSEPRQQQALRCKSLGLRLGSNSAA